MEHKHNDDILKTMGETIKGENGNTPATPQPKKQWLDIMYNKCKKCKIARTPNNQTKCNIDHCKYCKIMKSQ